MRHQATKLCTRCKKDLPLSEFNFVQKSKSSRTRSRCKKCCSQSQSERYWSDREKAYWQNVKQRLAAHGMTIADYERMYAEQDGKCAACGGPPRGPGANRGRFHVDHNHETGKVRGLLCAPCNTDLSLLENKQRMSALTRYLERTER